MTVLTIAQLAPLFQWEPRADFVPKSLGDQANAYARNQDRDVPGFRKGVGIGLIERQGAILRYSSTTEGAFSRPERAKRSANPHKKNRRRPQAPKVAVPVQRAPMTAAAAMARVAAAK